MSSFAQLGARTASAPSKSDRSDAIPAALTDAGMPRSSDLTCDISGNTDGQGVFTWDLDKGYSDTCAGLSAPVPTADSMRRSRRSVAALTTYGMYLSDGSEVELTYDCVRQP